MLLVLPKGHIKRGKGSGSQMGHELAAFPIVSLNLFCKTSGVLRYQQEKPLP